MGATWGQSLAQYAQDVPSREVPWHMVKILPDRDAAPDASSCVPSPFHGHVANMFLEKFRRDGKRIKRQRHGLRRCTILPSRQRHLLHSPPTTTENDDGTKPQETARKTERILMKQQDISTGRNYRTFLKAVDRARFLTLTPCISTVTLE